MIPTVDQAIAQLGLKLTPDEFVAIFRVQGPALISFSGGRTSALMLWCILVAWGGALPDGIVVTFANTGKERAETLRFVHDCASRWGVHVRWLEWRPTQAQVDARPTFQTWMAEHYPANDFVCDDGFVEVGFNSASRAGEPFAALIAMKQYAPNAVTRFCTQELKVRAMRDFCRSLGWDRWLNIIGLRHDEGSRILKAEARNASSTETSKATMPLAAARIAKAVVMGFWWGAASFEKRTFPQGFDLELRDYEGNCDLCFLKSRAKLCAIIREQPGSADWWVGQEAVSKGRFVTEYSFATLRDEVGRQPHLFDDFLGPDDDHDVECGLTCDESEFEQAAAQREYERGRA